MKVSATYRHVFKVTREVEVDEAEVARWAERRGWSGHDTELAIAAWLDEEGDGSEVFADWRTNQPLPDDFELEYSEVEDVEIPS